MKLFATKTNYLLALVATGLALAFISAGSAARGAGSLEVRDSKPQPYSRLNIWPAKTREVRSEVESRYVGEVRTALLGLVKK